MFADSLRRVAALFLCLLCMHPVARALDIVITPGSGLAGNGAALASLDRAASQWESLFLDPITINLSVNLTALGGGALAATSPVVINNSYGVVRTALIDDAAGTPSFATLTVLPTVAQFSTVLPAGFSTTGHVAVTKAEAKALGFSDVDAIFGASDGTIAFSSGYSYTFDRAMPVAGGYDFESIAAHEIGHALGFLSVVDQVYSLQMAGQSGAVSPFAFDFFRFASADEPNSLSEFTSATRSLTPGVAATFSDGASTYVMEAGGAGSYQASHWKNSFSAAIGLMNPTFAPGQIGMFTAADLLAFDLIGYDLAAMPVPEPATFWLMSAALILIATRRFPAVRRRRALQ